MPQVFRNIVPSSVQTLIPKKVSVSEVTGEIKTAINPSQLKNLYITSTHSTDDAKFNLYYEGIDTTLGTYHILKNHVMAPGTTLVFKGSEISFNNEIWELKLVMATGSLDIVGV